MAPAIDRLSVLPESLITAILSLIPLKDAVRTSVLSHGWKYTWRSRPNIVIHESNFSTVHQCLMFTNHWLGNYPHATIERFALTLSTNPPDVDIHPVLRWFVAFALAHDTKSLELDLPGPTNTAFELPEFVYQYDLLDGLKLFSCDFTVKNFVNLTWLKTASLGKIPLQNDAVKDLLMGCPLLESLVLFECTEATEFTVVSSKMKTLIVDSCLDLLHLTVITPELRRIKYVGALIYFGILDDLRMIEEADFDLGYSPYYDEESGELVQDLLVCFKNASVLKVCSYITQVLATAPKPWKLPTTMGIKNLIFKSAFHLYEFVGFACLFQSCPLLERIQFDVGLRQIYEDDEDHPCSELDSETFWGKDLGAPISIRNSLQEVEINGFGGSDSEFRFLKFLFDFGSVLKSVRVRVERDQGGEWVQLSRNLNRILDTWRRESVNYDFNIVIE